MTTSALPGRLVRLEPVTEQHTVSLLESISSDEVWAWKPVPRPRSTEEMQSIITDILIGDSGDRHPFAVVRLSDNAVIGSTTLYHVDMIQGRAEVGWTWLSRSTWGQGYNEDMKHILLRHSFEHLRLQRVAWTVDNLNVRSQRALQRLGFVYEGTLRSNRRRTDGSRSDTLVYSLLAEEWPAAAPHLQKLIDRRSSIQGSAYIL